METFPKVEIISYTRDPEATVVAAIRQCYSKFGASDLKKFDLLKKEDPKLKEK